MSWPDVVAWVIIVVSLSFPVLYVIGASLAGIRRLFGRGSNRS